MKVTLKICWIVTSFEMRQITMTSKVAGEVKKTSIRDFRLHLDSALCMQLVYLFSIFLSSIERQS